VHTSHSGEDSSNRVLIGNLLRGDASFPSEGSLSVCKTRVIWEIDSLGTFSVAIDTMEFNSTEGLMQGEIDLLLRWTECGLDWLL
jgi:hypothetical protein